MLCSQALFGKGPTTPQTENQNIWSFPHTGTSSKMTLKIDNVSLDAIVLLPVRYFCVFKSKHLLN